MNNAIETDCMSLVSGMQCNDQFGIRLTTSVPWRTVIFGVGGNTTSDWTLNMTETAIGASPCLPYCSMYLGGGVVVPGGPEGCIAEVCWGFDCSYQPDRAEIYVDGVLVSETYNPVFDNCYRTEVPVGLTEIKVTAYGGKRETTSSVTIRCP